MRIVVAGGGTAGHVTPTLVVASELKKIDPGVEIVYFRQAGDKFAKRAIAGDEGRDIASSKAILAGKFRRFHGVSWWKQAIDLPMQFRNLRDLVLFFGGYAQSLVLLIILKPDLVFAKGGYVGLPVGLAAHLLRIPIVIHESDTRMGLTNRVLAKRAVAIGVGSPTDYYDSFKEKLSFVGVPISSDFKRRGEVEKAKLKAKLGFDRALKLILVTGGSNGAKMINDATLAISKDLVASHSVAHVTGHETYQSTLEQIDSILIDHEKRKRYKVVPYVDGNMFEYIGAADVVVSRVGATTVAELAVSAKAAILIPNPKLVQGHQLVNAQVYQDTKSAIVLSEEEIKSNPDKLKNSLLDIINDAGTSEVLEHNIEALAKTDSAKLIAKLIYKAAGKSTTNATTEKE